MDARHDTMTIALHWATALLVITLFTLAETWGFTRVGSPLWREMQWLHISFGMLLAAVFVSRVCWRMLFARKLPPAASGAQQLVVSAVHASFYVLLAAQVVLGFLNCWASQPASFFGLFAITSPLVISGHPIYWIGFLHHYNAWLIMILAGGHAGAALAHHYILRDGVLRRMLPIR